MVDKFAEGFMVVFIVIIMTTLTIVVLTFAANFIIGEIIEIKKKIEEGFLDE